MSWFLAFVNTALVNLILSGDNTLAISLSANKLSGKLRSKAIAWGSVIAILLLMVFLCVGSYLIRIPVVKTVAGGLLLWVAIHLVWEHMRPAEADDGSALPETDKLWKAVRMIAVADLVMSLDNAVAMLGVAGGRLTVLIASLVVTIPFLIFGSHFIARILSRWQWIVYVAATYIAYLAGQMVAEDTVYQRFSGSDVLTWVCPAGAVALYAGVVAVGFLLNRRRRLHRPSASVGDAAEFAVGQSAEGN
ncbi:MAG: YjbE family putative metal transport protein [Alicyclobacillus sp.]|nr:YjbE family putative metal transport protein [Alicyclobacillus sp.]